MSEKNKNVNRKKLIATIALTIIIGIASVVPLTFFLTTTRAQVVDESWFNIDLPRAYLNVAVTDDGYQLIGGIAYDVSPNYAALSKHVNARVEYFALGLYIDDIQLTKTHIVLGTDNPDLENPTNMDTIRTEAWYSIPWLEEKFGVTVRETHPIPDRYGGIAISSPNGTLSGEWIDMEHAGRYTWYECNINEITDIAILVALENTQTIYFDIRRVACDTFDDNGTVTTSECDQLIQHIELTKNSNGEFTFGDLTAIENAFKMVGQQLAGTTVSIRAPVSISGSYLVE